MTGSTTGSISNSARSFADFVRDHGPAILAEWEHRARRQPVASDLTRPVLLNHIPQLLSCIAEIAEGIATGGPQKLPDEAAAVHAVQRLEVGLDLSQVVNEFALLRDCVLDRWESEHAAADQRGGLRALNRAIDQAVKASVQHYMEAQNRTLQALDRVSTAALESQALDDFLERLLRALLQTMPTVDTAAVLLLDDGMLRVRAAVGLEEDLGTELTLQVGEGFAGRVAAQRQPLLLKTDEIEAGVQSESLRRRRLQVLYGVPLIDRDQLIGVVHVGSLNAVSFSDQDRLLFGTMAMRATAAIAQHILHQAAELRARQQASIAELGSFGLLGDDPQQVMQRAAALVADVLEVDAAGIEQLDSAGNLILCESSGDWPEELPRPLEPNSQVRYALTAEQPVIVADYRHETRFAYPPDLQQRNIRSALLSPILLSGEASTRSYGMFVIYSRRQRSFSREDAVYLQAMGTVVASAIARRRAAEELLVGSNRLQAILDHSPAVIYLKDLQGRYTLANKRFEDIFSVSADAIVGKLDRELYPEAVATVLERNDEQALAQGDTFECEERIPVDGEPHIFHAVKFPLLDAAGEAYAVCGISIDVTERRQAEAALRDSEEQLRLAIAVADLGTFDWDLENGVIDWSSRVREVFGMPEDAPITRNLRAAHIHPDDHDRMQALFDRATDPATGGGYSAEYRVLPAEGSAERWVSAEGQVLFDADGRPLRFIGIVKDITDRKHADLKLEQLLRELEQAVRFREDMLAIVSHDLRSPLAAIKMSAALLTRRTLAGSDSRTHKQLDTILRACSRMEHLISGLLDMASIRAGQLSIEGLSCDAGALLDEALEFHAPVAAAKGVEVHKQVMVSGVAVYSDHDRIQQVFSNLLSNAIKFCGSGDSIQLLAERDGDYVRFTVKDSGPGIGPSELAHIFEPYWSAPQHARQGTGLGLFIAKGIIEAHGGRLWAESTPGEGCAFHFMVPVVEPASDS